ncbi:MAG TPA: serine hydrolase domain-containing protein [Candidatus Baltobacteraceae bacterium]|nr:serine hydrolase domain-containing protein [Candidatus Baltobacteraceae bacterium]
MCVSRYLAGCIAVLALGTASPASAANAFSASSIAKIVRNAMAQNHLKAVIVQVRSNGRNVYTAAFGESMAGVPATTDMHFRNGALAFTYMSTLLLEFVDQKKVTLQTKLSNYFPNLPDANRVTLKDLSQMTSGYADYVYQPELTEGLYRDPFRQWTNVELIRIGTSKPMQFAPGTNWGYSHTNYVILGEVLAKIAHMPLADALRRYVLQPMGLRQTVGLTTPYIPRPVLHSFTSERREVLGIKPRVPFFEESTYWNPSWTTNGGAVQITDISDLNTSLEAVATGKLLSRSSSAAQIKPSLIGFGHTQSNCPACNKNTTTFNYGLGVIITGPWITQTLGFAGASGAVGYLPARTLSIAVEATNGPGAYDDKGNAGLGATVVFRALADALAPKTMPPAR